MILPFQVKQATRYVPAAVNARRNHSWPERIVRSWFLNPSWLQNAANPQSAIRDPKSKPPLPFPAAAEPAILLQQHCEYAPPLRNSDLVAIAL
jgi:hypothetical protein